MIEIYRVKSLPDDYQCVWYQPQDKAMFDLFANGERIGDRWTTPQLILGDDSQGDFKIPDFPALNYHFLIASKRAWDVIRPLVEHAVEALPVVHPSGDRFFAINVTRVVDCLLVDRCKTNRLQNDPTGYFSSVHRYAFKEDAVRNEHLFRCPEMKAFEIYASKQFKQLVEENKLVGLKFIKVYPPKDKCAPDTREATPPSMTQG
jgi:hypothetical protein